MRAGALLVLAVVTTGFCMSTALAAGTDRGVSRPPAKLAESDKSLWMAEWVACRHKRLAALAKEIGVKIPPGRSPQAAAKLVARKAEFPLWDGIKAHLEIAIDGCRNGILWRYYHE